MECNTLYHVYNRANGADNLFVEEINYYFFIERIKKFLYPVSRIYAYCLMPNHFHFLLETKKEKQIEMLPKYQNYERPGLFISKQFSNCFSSYTQSFNKRYNRKGSLFMKNFKSKAILSDSYLNNLMAYIHANPINHGYCNTYEDWKFSSFIDIAYDEKLLVGSDEAIKFFDSKEAFLQFHEFHLSSKRAFEPNIKALTLPKLDFGKAK